MEVTFPGGSKGYSGPVSPNGQTLTIRPNTVPSNLNSDLSPAIAENQPVGTVVGDFNATDPDAVAWTVTYELLGGFALDDATGLSEGKTQFPQIPIQLYLLPRHLMMI